MVTQATRLQLSYTTSWFDSPEVIKRVVARAGLHTLTTGKYLISPGNTQHQGCDEPALWSTHTNGTPRKYRNDHKYPSLIYRGVWRAGLFCPFIVSRATHTLGHLMIPLCSSPTGPLYLLPSCFHSPPSLPVAVTLALQLLYVQERAIIDPRRNASNTTGKRLELFWPSGMTSGS